MTATTAPQLGKLYEVTKKGQLVLHFHAGQAAAWRSTARFTWMLAGTQSGKTAMSPIWLWREIRTRGPGDYLAVTSTFPLLKLKMLPEYIRFFRDTLHLGEWHAMDKTFVFDGNRCADHFQEAKWRNEPGRIIFGSGVNPEGLESATAKGAALDECGQDNFRLESYEAIERRLSLHQGRVLGGTTIYNLGWIKQKVYDPWQAGDPNHNVIQFSSTENPIFPKAEYERQRKLLPSWKFDMFYRGRMAKPAGLIYGDYSDEYVEHGGHKVRPFAIPSHWPCAVGVDFGAVNTALLWLAKDPETRCYFVYRERHGGVLSSKEHARLAKKVSEHERIVSWYGGAKGESQQRMDWTVAGVRVEEPPVSDVESGIDRTTGLLRERRLFVFDTCIGTRDELGTYSRPTDEQGEPLDGIKDKARFHRLDALRYVVLGVTTPRRKTLLLQGTVHRGWGL